MVRKYFGTDGIRGKANEGAMTYLRKSSQKQGCMIATFFLPNLHGCLRACLTVLCLYSQRLNTSTPAMLLFNKSFWQQLTDRHYQLAAPPCYPAAKTSMFNHSETYSAL